MRLFAILMLTALSFSAFAQDEASPPKEIATVWRGDSLLGNAEDMLKQKKYAEVLNFTDQMTARNMRNADAHVLASSAWYSLGNIQKAKESINNAIAIDKGHMGAYTIAGLISLKEENKNQAEYYLNAMRVVCRTDVCPEMIFLQKAIREYKED